MIKLEIFYKIFMYFQCCFTDQRNKRVPRLSHPFLAWKRNITGEKCFIKRYEPVHEISNNVVCATSKASDQPAHTCSLIRAFASRLSILLLLSY